MNILVLGDVVNREGCDFLQKKLPAFKKLKGIDFCIANGENSADGNGITPDSADRLFSSGVDFITTGNHVYRRKEIYDFLDENDFIIRPCNYSSKNPGRGSQVVDCGFFSIGIINVMGTMYMENLENPFHAIDREIEKIKEKTNIILVDFHAEATSEKKAMGFFLDSRVSAVFGTHTHVLTADATVLKGGTGYITDIGMCGVTESVLGVDKDIIIEKFRYNMPQRFDKATGSSSANGCIFTVDKATGRCTCAEAVSFE